MRIVDAHQHFWSLGEPGHEWPTPDYLAVYQDYGPGDLLAEVKGVDLLGTVLIQSQPTDHDTDWMLALAANTPLVKAVVGWVDFAAPTAPARISALAGNPLVRGFRPMLQGIADTEWLMRADLDAALDAIAAHRFRLDLLVEPRHLPMLARFARRWPGIPLVIDHAAKPTAARGGLDPWRDDIAALADLGFYCKLSGVRTEQAPGDPVADLAPCVDHLIDCFRHRLMWGSDWPVTALAGESWTSWLAQARDLAAAADADRLFVGAATEFYDLKL